MHFLLLYDIRKYTLMNLQGFTIVIQVYRLCGNLCISNMCIIRNTWVDQRLAAVLKIVCKLLTKWL